MEYFYCCKEKMKIGIYFTPKSEEGGAYQYSVEVLKALSKIKNNNYVVLSVSPNIPKEFYKLKNFRVIDVNSKVRDVSLVARNFIADSFSFLTSFVIKYLYKLRFFDLITPLYKISQKKYIDIIEKENIDMMIYPTSSNLSFLCKIPSVVTIHDLQHRLNPQFKEVSAGGRWEYREYGFINICKKSFKVLVDSEIGKEDLNKYYHSSIDKTVVLPYLPPFYLNKNISSENINKTIKKYKIPSKYIFYPSKFWPHKNHINLIKAIAILKKQGIKVNLVLTGSKSAEFSTYEDMQSLVNKFKLSEQIFYLGYINSDELSAVYKKASALVMPTSFGPTNIPVLEAWYVGVPVVYSSVRGCKEQLGDAGLLIDPYNPKDIAEKIKKVYTDKVLANKLILRGYKRLSLWNRFLFANRIKNIIKDFDIKR